jgi:hypothetical protein
MPENETLFPDARTASRWQPLRERIERGESPEQIFLDYQDQFYRMLKSVFKQWKDQGVEPEQLFEAALDGDPTVLTDFVNRTGNNEFARLLQDAISGKTDLDRAAVIRLFLNSACDYARDYVRVDCHEDGVTDAFLKGVNKMLDRLICGLRKNPSRVPNRPPQNKPPRDINDALDELLPLA